MPTLELVGLIVFLAVICFGGIFIMWRESRRELSPSEFLMSAIEVDALERECQVGPYSPAAIETAQAAEMAMPLQERLTMFARAHRPYQIIRDTDGNIADVVPLDEDPISDPIGALIANHTEFDQRINQLTDILDRAHYGPRQSLPVPDPRYLSNEQIWALHTEYERVHGRPAPRPATVVRDQSGRVVGLR